MQPIKELLARIRWDAKYAHGLFEIGYWDRVAGRIQRVELRDVTQDADNPSFLSIVDGEGGRRSIPFHRVRKVWRDNLLIWDRDPPPGQDES